MRSTWTTSSAAIIRFKPSTRPASSRSVPSSSGAHAEDETLGGRQIKPQMVVGRAPRLARRPRPPAAFGKLEPVDMSSSPEYTPPKVWSWNKPSGGQFANINRPIAGPMHEKELPVGRHPLQLYSLATPNGQKVTIMLEELLALGKKGAEYDAWLIRIGERDQFGSGFVGVNPNSKIPAMVDRSGPTPIRVFESAAILLY